MNKEIRMGERERERETEDSPVNLLPDLTLQQPGHRTERVSVPHQILQNLNRGVVLQHKAQLFPELIPDVQRLFQGVVVGALVFSRPVPHRIHCGQSRVLWTRAALDDQLERV